jgi:hypothetical protein
MSRESFYTDRDYMIKESKEDDETPMVNDWTKGTVWVCFPSESPAKIDSTRWKPTGTEIDLWVWLSDIILMASNSSNFYVLKYNIKHALEESEHSSTQSLTADER